MVNIGKFLSTCFMGAIAELFSAEGSAAALTHQTNLSFSIEPAQIPCPKGPPYNFTPFFLS